MSTKKKTTARDGGPCIVTQDGRPCALLPVTSKKLGAALIPGAPAEIFRTHKRARGAIARTQRLVATLRGSLIAEWDKLQPLFSGVPFAIEAVRLHCERKN